MSELNPCPNCGSEPDIFEYKSEYTRISCIECEHGAEVISESASGAINAWNDVTANFTQPIKTLRDEFAMAALTGILSDRDTALRIGKIGMDNLVCPAKLTATGAYAIADAMLKEREK